MHSMRIGKNNFYKNGSMNNFLRAQLRHFSINSIYNTIRPGVGLVCGMVALLAMLAPGDATAAIGFSGGAVSPATQQVCSGSTGTFTFNPTTCSLGAGPDWSGTYSVDSSSDGITWFVASGASTGVITAASPTPATLPRSLAMKSVKSS